MDSFRVIQRSRGVYTTEIRPETVWDRCQEVMDGLEDSLGNAAVEIDHGERAVPLDQYDAYVKAATAIADIEQVFPPIECFVVGYYWSDGEHWSGFWGCRTEEQANALAAALNREQPGQRRTHRDDWIVRRTGVSFGQLVAEDWTPEEAVEKMRH